jgi:hypothetical protein
VKPVAAALLIVIALLGAAGLSSLQDDDFCSEYGAETQTVTGELTLWPPGWRCVYEPPRTVVNAGSVPWFLIALAGMGLVAGLALRRRAGAPARVAATTTAALAGVGICGLLGGFAFGFVAGCALGVPLAWLADVAFARAEGGRRSRRRSLTAALVGGLAVFATAVIATLGVEAVAAASFVVACVAGATAAMERAVPGAANAG